MHPLTLFWSPDFTQHEVSWGHPESASRLAAIQEKLNVTGQWEGYHRVEATAASLDQIALIHPMEYIRRVERTTQRGPTIIDSADTEVSPGSYLAALKVAGAGLRAVDEILAANTRTAFILGRPPGHHALPSTAMGFCLFSNAALAATYALQSDQIERVAVIDWDVHHGNGTQHIFYESERVYYISIHEFPLYPGTGRPDEIGSGQGRGHTLNFPLSAGKGDDDYLEILVGPVAETLHSFRPDLIIISAGFDAHEYDPLGHMNISSEGFEKMTRVLVEVGQEQAHGRIISFLEGGYHLQALADSVSRHLRGLAGESQNVLS
ncbi:MAG: histone deacetylase [Fidelibacterota bacterium]|nr:MAG: histone deacetylase [Candidatus Neomarinimicrobiota bacterium]